MEKVFLSILNMSLTASFIIAAIMLARLPLKKAPKIISYALWAVAGFRLLFPFTLESVFSLLPFKAAPIPQDIAMQTVPRIDSGIAIIDNVVSASLPAANPVASVNPLQIWIFIGSCVWLIGIAVMLIYSFVSIVLLKRRLHGATLIEGNLYEADNLKTPFVIGLFKPRIYIPAGLTDEERRYIILHEQTHIRRGDHIVKMLAYFILCLHWFNPLAWAAFILMGADMEMSCDERVMRELGRDIKNAYSMSLVRVAAGRKILNGSPLAFGEGGMKERVKNVLNFKKPSRVIIVAAVALVAVLSVGFAANRTTSGNTLILRDLNLDFTNIEITNTTSEWGVRTLNVERTDALCQLLWDMPFVKDVKYSGQFDSMFHLKFLFGSEEVEEIYVLSNNSIVYNGNIYKVSDGFIDLGFIENLYLSYDVIGDEGQSWDRRPMVFIDGSIYMDTNEEVSVKTNSITISGTILSSVDSSEIPTENGQSNFGCVGADYAYFEDGIIVKINDKWFFFVTENRADTTTYNDETIQRVEEGLRVIMSSPLHSSNPQDYINEHNEEYENLTAKYPDGVLDYLLSQFEDGNTDGLRGQIMMQMCKDMLGLQNNVTDESLSPQEWYKQLSIISEIKLPDFKPENPMIGVYDGAVDGKVYGGIFNSAIVQHYGNSERGFLVYAPTIYGAYEEEGKLKVFVTVYYEYYRLYGKTLEQTGGAVIPGAIIYTKEDRTGGWVFEEYLEIGTASLPDGMYYNDSIQKLCVMPVSGTEIKGLADEMNSDYNSDTRRELLAQSLREHLMSQGQTGVSLKTPGGEMVPLT